MTSIHTEHAENSRELGKWEVNGKMGIFLSAIFVILSMQQRDMMYTDVHELNNRIRIHKYLANMCSSVNKIELMCVLLLI